MADWIAFVCLLVSPTDNQGGRHKAILDAHYLGRDIQVAEEAVLKLEQRTKL